MSRTAFFLQVARADMAMAALLAKMYGVTQAQIDLWSIQYAKHLADNRSITA